MPKPRLFIWQGEWQGGAEHITLEAAKFFTQHGLPATLGVYQKDLAVSLPQIAYKIPNWIPASFRPLVASFLFRRWHAASFQGVYTQKIGIWKTRRNRLFVHEGADLDAYQANLPTVAQRFAAWLWRFLYRRLTLRRADILFAGSKAAEQYFHRLKIPAARIVLSSSFYDEKTFLYISRKLPPIPPYQILLIGNYLDPRKNFARVYRELYGSKEFVVNLIGGKAKPADKNFQFHGFVDKAEFARLLAQAYICLLPSHSEGFSVALLEALATGCPCVVASASLNQELRRIPNLIALKTSDSLAKICQTVIKNFTTHAQPNDRLKHFTLSHVLTGELTTIQNVLTNSQNSG